MSTQTSWCRFAAKDPTKPRTRPAEGPTALTKSPCRQRPASVLAGRPRPLITTGPGVVQDDHQHNDGPRDCILAAVAAQVVLTMAAASVLLLEGKYEESAGSPLEKTLSLHLIAIRGGVWRQVAVSLLCKRRRIPQSADRGSPKLSFTC
jgi:hypothetical protein